MFWGPMGMSPGFPSARGPLAVAMSASVPILAPGVSNPAYPWTAPPKRQAAPKGQWPLTVG
jgi:hypothetical protein